MDKDESKGNYGPPIVEGQQLKMLFEDAVGGETVIYSRIGLLSYSQGSVVGFPYGRMV